MVAACGVTPTPTLAPTSAATPTVTRTVAQPVTPTATQFAITKGEWVSRKETDGGLYYDASIAYQFVGSKNNEHTHLLDLTFGTLNVGVMVSEDLITLPLTLQVNGDNVSVLKEPQKLAQLKDTVAVRLTSNTDFLRQVLIVQDALRKLLPAETQKGFGNSFVIIDGTSIIQVIQKQKNPAGADELVHFKVDGNGDLVRYQDFELYSRSPLETREGKFWRDGKEFIPRGAVLPHFLYFRSILTPELNLENYKRDLNNLVRLGGNFVSLFINLGDEFVGNSNYRETLALACEYAKSRGLAVEITAKGYGRYDGPDAARRNFDSNNEAITRIDRPDLLLEWWKNFLIKDKAYTKRLGASIDIINPAPELDAVKTTENKVGLRLFQWTEIKDTFRKIHDTIQSETENSRFIRTYIPPYYASDMTEVFNDPNRPHGFNEAFEWHPYQVPMKYYGRDVEKDSQSFTEKGLCTFVGELGADDPNSYVHKQLEVFVKVGMGFAFWSLISTSNLEYNLVASGKGTTLRGYLAMIYFGKARTR